MKDLFKNLKFAWKYTRGVRLKLFFFVLLCIIQVGISIFVPIISANIIVNLTNNLLIQVLNLSIVLLFTNFLINIVVFLNHLFSRKVYREVFINIQSELGREILKLENQCIDNNSSGVFIQRLTNDTSSIAEIFNVLKIYITNILTDVGIFAAIFFINKKIFVFVLIMISIIYLIDRRRVILLNERDKEFRRRNENVAGFVGEIVRGIRDIKMLGAEENFINELHNKVVNLNQYRYMMLSVDGSYSLLRGTYHDLFDMAIIFLCVYFIYTNELTIASALIIHNYMGRVARIVGYGGMLMEKIKNFSLSSTRIFNIINSDDFTKEKFGNVHLDSVKGNFEFKDVTFGYKDGNDVLKDLSFKIKSRETVAFVGKSGSGKSTIFSLLCKMYTVNSGKITIDGVDINELDRESIRNNITIINQNPYIFNMSIRDNLRLVKSNLTDEEMIEACKVACLDDFINCLDDKYNTIVGEGGINLSGGQRQRLAIARALIQKTEIILFDEATSALDNETQEKIQKAISNLHDDYTILIVAHRLSTIVNSDRILFLNDGHIEANGSHKELMNSCKNYKKLYETEIRRENEEEI